ncbi:transcriptional regulator, TetR family [Pseudonocardia ammonioxydans]|uniref:Transcriptional regulator, TetR family n=1 Tax=Pseudonocardia ammonioxydans TaxID=260086 RepID=A0A1I4XKE5_PSUAM|nr:TetR/AcrR family transcriptional regulator [Pseudonocardia ammonioxydans]SFN25719.1 transcriptional regulator, TetR family [Pseudonocardia ammonioxydans]
MGKGVPSRHQGDPLASGRVNQKRRTREAILDAARTLLDEGRVPSVGEAADAALVGRTTAYRYFPTQESLILEASMDSVVAVLDDTDGPADDTDGPDGDGAEGTGDPAERVDRVLRTMHGRIAEHEAAFRAIIRLSLEKQARLGPGDTGEVRLLEGRRLAWMQDALEPARDDLPPDVHADLVAALAMLAGTESFIALKDACRVDDPHERSRIIRWTARMLLTGVLAHSAPAPGDDTPCD